MDKNYRVERDGNKVKISKKELLGEYLYTNPRAAQAASQEWRRLLKEHLEKGGELDNYQF